MLLMKRGILIAFLFWISMSVGCRKQVEQLVDSTIQTREQDLDMALPNNENAEKDGIKVVFIQLNAEGRVFMGKDKLVLDADPQNSEMPLLKAELEKLKASGEEFSVTISADGEVKPQRVIDLLNILATADITQITVVKE
jgi:biopolymer transport protein ExbD